MADDFTDFASSVVDTGGGEMPGPSIPSGQFAADPTAVSTPAAPGGGGGGFWDSIGSGLGKFASNLGADSIGGGLKALTAGLGLGSQALGISNQLSAQKQLATQTQR